MSTDAAPKPRKTPENILRYQKRYRAKRRKSFKAALKLLESIPDYEPVIITGKDYAGDN